MTLDPKDLANLQRGNPIVGTPEIDTAVWDGKQNYDDTCAIRAQEFILEQFTGQEIDETALVQVAEASGWYEPGVGTPNVHIGNLLDKYGIPVAKYEGANAFDLANELAQGHKVMIAVDKDELWQIEGELDSIDQLAGIDPGSDHAVVVSGIDTADPDPNNWQVYVSDPGTGEPAARYPMAQFLDAWQDSNFYMVATQVPTPAWRPEMANFDYEQGHIPEVIGVPYEEFLTYKEQPEAWEAVIEQCCSPAEVAQDPTQSPVPPSPEPGLENPFPEWQESQLSQPVDNPVDTVDEPTDDVDAAWLRGTP